MPEKSIVFLFFHRQIANFWKLPGILELEGKRWYNVTDIVYKGKCRKKQKGYIVMSLFGKEKKHKKNNRRGVSGRKGYFPDIDDYDDDYEDEEYEGGGYYEDESEEYEEEEYYGEESEEYIRSQYEEEPEEYTEEEYGEEEPEEYIREQYYEEVDGCCENEAEESEYYEEEYYGDDVNYYEDGTEDEEFYEEDEDEDLYYVDDGEYEDYDEDDEDDDFVAYHRKRGVAGVLLAFRNAPLVDKVIAFTGVAVLVFAVLTGTIFMTAKSREEAVAAFTEVGTSLDGIKIIGESGLLAVADAQLSKETAAELEEETQVVEEEPVQGASVALKTTSIVKDLKMKFVNTASDKLIANVPFQVEVTTPSKKTETWTDDDRDGVIYKENIEAGTYKVRMLELTGEGYSDYKISTETQSVEVKANIDYKKVDVKEEIKTEAEVNAAVEDTAVAEVVEESKLTDTVPFIKSTQTGGGEISYNKIDKSTIMEPGATASIDASDYYLMTAPQTRDVSENNPPATLSIDKGPVYIKVGESKKIEVKENTAGTITWSSGNTGIATVDSSGTIKGIAAGTTNITASAGGLMENCTVTVTAAAEKPTLTINPTTLSLAAGAKGTITASTNQATVSWVSSDTNVASVAAASDTKSATVEGKKAGKATITVTAGDVVQTCAVTVTDTGVVLDKNSVQVQVQKTVDVKVTTVPESAKIKEVVTGKKEIATAAFKDKVVTVTGVALGDTEIIIRCDNGKEAKLAVKVVNNFALDTTSLLKDKNGNQVFVYENGKYRKAVYADYYKFNEFYLESQEILYTGWQNINGKTFYYLENHQYVTGEQVIQGAKYTFASDGTLVTSSGTFGIDVSKWNGNIDWNSVKSSGASYAIIRCGYRGSSTGALITDPKFAANISGANAAGLKVGVYFFTQAVNEKEAVEEASMVLDLVKKYKISYPIFLDVESSGGRADGIDKGTRTAVCKAFCATIQNSGYTAGVYANKTWLNSKIDAGALGSYKIWLAQYAAAPSYNGRYNLWQYSSKGSVPGIKGNVDMNQSYLGY